MLRSVFAFALVSLTLGCDVQWPNGTDTKYNWWQCGGDITFTNAVPQDAKGNYEYPVHLSQPLFIVADGTNPTNTYDTPNLKQTIHVWSWSTSCKWVSVPTFGLLNNLDACTNGVNCPIKPGNQKISFELDFSDVPQIIALLQDDAPYELQYILNDLKYGSAACLTFQARAFVK